MFRFWKRPKDAELFDASVLLKDDSGHECCRCGATENDVVGMSASTRQRLIACCFCGAMVWIPGGVEVEEGDRITTLPSGRYRGLTFKEVASQENGIAYLKYLVQHGDPLASCIEEFLRTRVDGTE